MSDDYHAYEMAEEAECRMHANDELREELRELIEQWRNRVNSHESTVEEKHYVAKCAGELEELLNDSH